MRKRDPDAVIDQFKAELAASLFDWGATQNDVGEGGRLARRASMDAFTRMAVAYERFRSEWHIAAITRDASSFVAAQLRRVAAALEETDRDQLLPYLPAGLALPKHPTLKEVGDILDPSGGNLSISGVALWRTLADKHLCNPWKAKVHGLTWADEKVTDAVVALRNAAAHQSPRSHDAMTAALGELTHPTHIGLQRPARGVPLAGIPVYLNGPGGAQTRRVERYHRLLDDIAERLRLP
jgi:hypothetical protein